MPSGDVMRNYIPVAAAKADSLVPFVRIRLFTVDKHRGAVKIPDDIVVRTAVKGKNAEIRFDPVDSVVALRIAGQVAAVIVHKSSSVFVLSCAVVIVRFLVGARHVQAGNLIVAALIAPVRSHSTGVPHPVLPRQIIVKRRSVNANAFAHPSPAILPRFIPVRLHDEVVFLPGLNLSFNPALRVNQSLVKQQHTLVN